jgi:hypothetical protein
VTPPISSSSTTDARGAEPAAILNLGPKKAQRVLSRGASQKARQMFAWWDMLPLQHRKESPPPKRPPGVPFLVQHGHDGKGRIGWLHLENPTSGRGAPRNTTEEYCFSLVRELSRVMGNEGQVLWPSLECRGGGTRQLDGSSASLAALLDWIFSALGVHPENEERCALGRWVATGGWDPRSGKLTPVDGEMIQAKVEVARSWGYTTLIVVEQQQIPDDVHPDQRFIEVPSDPVDAVLTLLGQPEMRAAMERNPLSTQRVLQAVRHGWTQNPKHRTDQAPEIVRALHQHASKDLDPTVLVLTSDILGRHAFRRGEEDAFGYLQKTREMLPRARFHDRATALYYRGEWHTSIAEGLIDVGIWDKNHPAWRELSEVSRQSYQPWDVPSRFGLFALDNQASFRDLFQARIETDGARAMDALQSALDLRLRHSDYWDHFWIYQDNRKDTYPGRQANLLIEVCWTAHLLERQEVFGVADRERIQSQVTPHLRHLQQCNLAQEHGDVDYDTLGQWTDAHLAGDLDERERLSALVIQRARAAQRNRPDRLLSRSPLRWNLERMLLVQCDPSGHAVDILQEALEIDLESAAERNVIALLTARTAALLAAADGAQQIPEIALNATEPLEGKLLQLWNSISDGGNTPLTLRCPY